jgi:hypothetical protein
MMVATEMKRIRLERNPELSISTNLVHDLRMDGVAYQLGFPSLHDAFRVCSKPMVTARTRSLETSCRGRCVGQVEI